MLSWIVAGLMLTPPPPPLMPSADILRNENTNWQEPPAENTIYMDLPTGRVVIYVGQEISRRNVAQIKALVRAGAFDGGTIDRVQENYVVQWSANPDAPRGDALNTVPGEAEGKRGVVGSPNPVPFSDSYAPQVGFIGPFPAAQDGRNVWLAHCYGMVGVGRGDDMDGADGTELYVVAGQAPRHLDRNITLVGRVLMGMEHLTTLPRGKGELGFYTDEQEKVSIERVSVAADLPPGDRTRIEVMLTKGLMWDNWVQTRANRATDGWFTYSHGAVDLCNIPVPVREVSSED